MDFRNTRKWSIMMAAGLISLGLIGGSSLLAQASGSTASTPAPILQPTAKPPIQTNQPTSQQFVPTEPGEKESCGFCQMVVYPKTADMGQYTAQLITADGKRLFFDDLGCMMNYKHTLAKPAQVIWVRDYYTKEWFLASKAVLVSSELKSPMHYGYAVFKDQALAAKFIKENQTYHAALSTWKVLDAKAQERVRAKMNKTQAPSHQH